MRLFGSAAHRRRAFCKGGCRGQGCRGLCKGVLKAAAEGSERARIKLLGFTWHGDVHYFFLCPPWLPKSANTTCTALYYALLDAKARRTVLPSVLRINIDGGSENWNWTTFAFCGYLVALNIVKEVWPFRMPVGHTHNDQDATFAKVRRCCSGHACDCHRSLTYALACCRRRTTYPRDR